MLSLRSYPIANHQERRPHDQEDLRPDPCQCLFPRQPEALSSASVKGHVTCVIIDSWCLCEGPRTMPDDYEVLVKRLYEINPKVTEQLKQALFVQQAALKNAMDSVSDEQREAGYAGDAEECDRLGVCFRQLAEILSATNRKMKLLDSLKEGAGDVLRPKPNQKPVAPNEPIEHLDYAAYALDRRQPHHLDEDFTDKRVCGFSFGGRSYEAESWKDTLVQVCQLVRRRYPNKFDLYVQESCASGHKRTFFSDRTIIYSGGTSAYSRIPGTDVYVLTNSSANTLRDDIKRVLKLSLIHI